MEGKLPTLNSEINVVAFGYLFQLTFKVVVKISVVSNSMKGRKKEKIQTNY